MEIRNLLIELNNSNFGKSDTTLEKNNRIEKEEGHENKRVTID